MNECKKLKRDTDNRGLNNETIQMRLEEANTIQEEMDTLTKAMNVRILEIIKDYSSRKKPLYDKRHEVLKSIPHFWAIAFINHPKLRLLINNSIEDCFHYLQYIQVVEANANEGFQINFEFVTNPYFYNKQLAKIYVRENDEYQMKKTLIDWKENMNLSSDNKKSGRKRGAPLENFFGWMSRGASNDIICDIIKDDLWMDPLKYYFMSDEGNEDSDSDCEDDNDDCDDFLDSKDDFSDEDESNMSENGNDK